MVALMIQSARRRTLDAPHCIYCGQFLSWRYVGAYAVRWTPHGDYLDLDPPDEEFAHLRCWNGDRTGLRRLITGNAWLAPYSKRRMAS